MGAEGAERPGSDAAADGAGRQGSDAAATEPQVPIELSVREEGRWEALPGFSMPGSGTYLGLMSLDKRPRTIDSVRLTFSAARRIEILDLALVSFG